MLSLQPGQAIAGQCASGGRASWRRKFCLHGAGIDLACHLHRLVAPINQFLGEFLVDALPEGFATTSGIIRGFEETDVSRHLSTSAQRCPSEDDWLEIYAEAERFWLIDE